MLGKLIVLEGIDGCGKTTQLTYAADYLRQEGMVVKSAREPGGTAIGEMIRRVLLAPENQAMSWQTELLLFMACRAQIVYEVIAPALQRDEWVLLDRFADSSMAYQGFGRGLPIQTIRELNVFAMLGRQPDMVMLLDCPVEVAMMRRHRGEADRIEQSAIDFHQKVADGFRQMFLTARSVGRKSAMIDSNRPEEVVAAEVRGILKEMVNQYV